MSCLKNVSGNISNSTNSLLKFLFSNPLKEVSSDCPLPLEKSFEEIYPGMIRDTENNPTPP